MTTSHHVLLLGGHGKIALLLTPLLLRRSWTVTSVIRTPEQVPEITALGANEKAGTLHVLVRSLEEMRSDADAKAVLDEVRPDMVVWSAGAGGKGNPERTFLIDRDTASYFIRASTAVPFITKFIMVSYLGSRRGRPSWWDDASWKTTQDINAGVLARYYQAKIAADEVLYREAKKRGDGFAGVCLRPGTLTLEPAGKVELGKTVKSRGAVSRETVAKVADLLLAKEGIRTSWLDLLDGEEDAEAAVDRVIKEGVDAIEGEPVLNE